MIGRTAFEIRRIPMGTADHEAVLHRVLGVPSPVRSPGPAPPVERLLHSARHGAVSIDLLLGAYQHAELVGAALAVESPGRAAMVFLAPAGHSDVWHRAAVAVLRALQTVAWSRSIALLEVLLPAEHQAEARAVAEAGFRRITRLLYLRRDASAASEHLVKNELTATPDTTDPSFAIDLPVATAFRGGGGAPKCTESTARSSVPPRSARGAVVADLEWIRYAPEYEALFQRALERSYVDSQDCPELTSLRSTTDVLASHRGTEAFDAALWCVARLKEEPVGVLLLNRIPSERALEVDYMGVAAGVRGRGVGDALLDRAVSTARRNGAAGLALAVDERNGPARRLYARWGFVQTGARDAWIASPPGAIA